MSIANRYRRSIGNRSAALTLLLLAPSMAATGLAADREQVLYLQAQVNQVSPGRMARFVLRQDTLHASSATLWELGLKLPADQAGARLIALPSLPGITLDYNAALQQLDLTVPVDMLTQPTTHLDLSQTEPDGIGTHPPVSGAALNYDLYGLHSGRGSTLSGFSELRLFGLGQGVWSNTMSSRLANGSQMPRHQARNTRLDSLWQLNLPNSMLTFSVGDSMTSAQDWSRATRFGGVRLSRNFALQPYRITTPLASFAGQAVLPSTVDLYIDGIRQASQPLPPGRFQLDSNPSLNGAGQAQLVITDINGQSRSLDFSLYGTPLLLQAGLSDWSLELGAIRRDYGQRSFRYGDAPLFSGSLRHGLSNRLTFQAHAEGSDDIAQAGVGSVLLLGQRGGVLSSSLAGSRAGAMAGQQWSAGYQWNSPGFSIAASTLRRSPGYRDVAAVHEDAQMARRANQVFFGLSTPAGQLGASYVAQRQADRSDGRHASLSWSHTLAGNALLNVSLNRDLEARSGDSAFVYWSMPLDGDIMSAASARHARGGNALSVEASRSSNEQTAGLGWRAQLTAGNQQRGARAQFNQQGRYGQWSAGLDYNEGTPTLAHASVNGGLLWLGRRVQALPRLDDAFALVSTNGMAGVPVLLENRSVGVTDQHGQLLVPRLNAWQRNQLSVDPLQLPADVLLQSTRQDVAPPARSGVLVEFSMHRSLAVHVGIRHRNGQWLPAGSHVTVQASGHPPLTTQVGHEGKVYLVDPPLPARLHFSAEHGRCSADLPAVAVSHGRLELEDVLCR